MKGVLEPPPSSNSKRVVAPELRLELRKPSVWFPSGAPCITGAILAPPGASSSAAPWSLVLLNGVKVVSAPSQAALLGYPLVLLFCCVVFPATSLDPLLQMMLGGI